VGRFFLKGFKQNMQLPSVRYRERLHFQLSQTYSLNQKEYVPVQIKHQLGHVTLAGPFSLHGCQWIPFQYQKF